jgi:hypothetical protein
VTKPYNPSELLEFVAQAPPRDEDGGQGRLSASAGEAPRVIVVGFKVPFADLMAFSLKLILAAVPVVAVAAAAVYAVVKFLPKLL